MFYKKFFCRDYSSNFSFYESYSLFLLFINLTSLILFFCSSPLFFNVIFSRRIYSFYFLSNYIYTFNCYFYCFIYSKRILALSWACLSLYPFYLESSSNYSTLNSLAYNSANFPLIPSLASRRSLSNVYDLLWETSNSFDKSSTSALSLSFYLPSPLSFSMIFPFDASSNLKASFSA